MGGGVLGEGVIGHRVGKAVEVAEKEELEMKWAMEKLELEEERQLEK